MTKRDEVVGFSCCANLMAAGIAVLMVAVGALPGGTVRGGLATAMLVEVASLLLTSVAFVTPNRKLSILAMLVNGAVANYWVLGARTVRPALIPILNLISLMYLRWTMPPEAMPMAPVDFHNRRVSRFKNPPEGEQEFVREFFNNKPHGFYVDVGANDPVVLSQTWHLEQMGWDGILIEPLPSYCEKLSAQRTGKVVQVACSSPENHGQTLRLLVAGGHSTLNPAPIARGTQSQEYASVECRTLDSVLQECGAPVGFDFLSIDIEGHEMEMFKGFTLQKWMPKLVLLEDHVTSHDKHRFMLSRGYQLILRTGLDSWYVPEAANYSLTPFAKLQMFRKYWLGLLGRRLRYAR